jgi:hypothetical protein
VAIGKIKELKSKINTVDKLFSDLKRLKNDIYEHLGEDAFGSITEQFEKLNEGLKANMDIFVSYIKLQILLSQ